MKKPTDISVDNESLSVSLAFLAGVALASLWRARREATRYRGKLVLVTGGTRGLGRALVREFASGGARVIFCARHNDELERTERELREEGLEVFGMVADLTRPDAPLALAQRIEADHGSIDILINNAGVIQVLPFLVTEEEQFHHCMDLFVYAPLRLSRAVLPGMIEKGEGAIINIASVGGQVANPHMTPYNCGKAALVALSEGMSVELDRFGVHVLTVIPGLMRTGGHRNARFAGRPGKEYAWFSRMSVNPMFAASPYRMAGQIRDALERRKRTLYAGWESSLGPLFHKLFPELSMALSSAMEKLLPAGGPGGRPVSGDILAQEDRLGPLLGRLEEAALREHQKARVATPPST